MKLINWVGTEVKRHNNEPDYEWASIKAHLDNSSDDEVLRVYKDMFGKTAKAGAPLYLVQLAIQYGALNLGYARIGKSQPSIEKVVFACVEQLDETAFKNNRNVFRYCQLHDTEEVEFQRKPVLEIGVR